MTDKMDENSFTEEALAALKRLEAAQIRYDSVMKQVVNIEREQSAPVVVPEHFNDGRSSKTGQ